MNLTFRGSPGNPIQPLKRIRRDYVLPIDELSISVSTAVVLMRIGLLVLVLPITGTRIP